MRCGCPQPLYKNEREAQYVPHGHLNKTQSQAVQDVRPVGQGLNERMPGRTIITAFRERVYLWRPPSGCRSDGWMPSPSGLLEAQQLLRDDVNQTPGRYSKNIRDIPQEPNCNKTYSTDMPKSPCVLPRSWFFQEFACRRVMSKEWLQSLFCHSIVGSFWSWKEIVNSLIALNRNNWQTCFVSKMIQAQRTCSSSQSCRGQSLANLPCTKPKQTATMSWRLGHKHLRSPRHIPVYIYNMIIYSAGPLPNGHGRADTHAPALGGGHSNQLQSNCEG